MELAEGALLRICSIHYQRESDDDLCLADDPLRLHIEYARLCGFRNYDDITQLVVQGGETGKSFQLLPAGSPLPYLEAYLKHELTDSNSRTLLSGLYGSILGIEAFDPHLRTVYEDRQMLKDIEQFSTRWMKPGHEKT